MFIDRRLISQFDWGLFILTLLLPMLGMVVLYSAGYAPDAKFAWFPALSESIPSPVLLKQATFLLVGTVVLLLSASVPTQWLYRLGFLAYWICIVLLIAVELVGTVQNGSQRWLTFGSINIQPSEPMKLALVLALARYISKYPPREGGYRFTQLFAPGFIVALPMALIMAQPDLGTALSLGGVGACMLLFAGVDKRCLIGFVVLAVLLAYPAWHALHDYQQQRILTLFNPEIDPRGSGYHIIQSIIAVGSGSLFGKGFLNGTQTQLQFLPEHTTDFIFSVLAEEWGFFGAFVVIGTYAAFLYRLLRVSSRSRDVFGAMVAVGIASLIFLHVLINIGMVIGLLPVVGIPLVLFSYGGSSLLSTMFSLGIVLGISTRRMSLGKGM